MFHFPEEQKRIGFGRPVQDNEALGLIEAVCIAWFTLEYLLRHTSYSELFQETFSERTQLFHVHYIFVYFLSNWFD